MGEEPVFPPIPAIGDVLDRKDRFFEKKHTVIKCGECQNKFSRIFKPGDFVFKKLSDEQCNKCQRTNKLTVVEIYSEWIDPKKQK